MSWVCLAEEPMKDADDLIQVIAGERVQNTLRLATRSHEVGSAQLGQMLGQRGLTEASQLLQFGHPPLAAEELTKNEQAVLVAHGLQALRRRTGRMTGYFYIHSC
jgi:hypothetical protein